MRIGVLCLRIRNRLCYANKIFRFPADVANHCESHRIVSDGLAFNGKFI